MSQICVISGLEIPAGQESIEHWIPRSRAPRRIWNNPRNLYPAQYMLNAVKNNYLGCEWEDMKYTLTYNAVKRWKIQDEDRDFLLRAIKNWESYHINPCDLCLFHCKEKDR